jgi:NAD(P)-dependent dehydrogenase (short-subunit alcohol dehydrogenase family)
MSDITFDFTGKNVLVVGGSRGIGKEVVTRFLESNANVFYTILINYLIF